MILYVNGGGHAAAAEAASAYYRADDDKKFFYMGAIAHPMNLAVSWASILANKIKMGLHCDASVSSSNRQIRRQSRQFLQNVPDVANRYLVIIQWNPWHTSECEIDGRWYQIGCEHALPVPPEHQDRYQQLASEHDTAGAIDREHAEIWQFHQDLMQQQIRHIFFNGHTDFSTITERQDWGTAYINPYDPAMTFSEWLKSHGHDTVSPKSPYFGPDGHAAWARFMLQYVMKNQVI